MNSTLILLAAEAVVPDGNWNGFVAGLIGVGASGVIGLFLGRLMRAKQNPMDVQLVETLATKEELRDIENRIERRFDEIKQAIHEDRKVARENTDNMFSRINAISIGLAQNQGESKQLISRLEQLTSLLTTLARR